MPLGRATVAYSSTNEINQDQLAMWITISGYNYEGEVGNSMHIHSSRGKAEEWVKENRNGDYIKLYRGQPDGSFEFIAKI